VSVLPLHAFSLIKEIPWLLWPDETRDGGEVFSVNGMILPGFDCIPTHLQFGVDSSCLFLPAQLNNIGNQAIQFKLNSR